LITVLVDDELKPLEVWVGASVTTGCICELDAMLVSTLFVISLAPLAAATGGSMLGKDVVTAAAEAVVSLADDGFFRKSSVGRPRMIRLINTNYITSHTLISFLVSFYYRECP
jgi:hypothetical protein